jgi:vacuolar-type H+-ATPase subunit D/Vma8
MSLSDNGDAINHGCGAENGHPLLTKKREEAIYGHMEISVDSASTRTRLVKELQRPRRAASIPHC